MYFLEKEHDAFRRKKVPLKDASMALRYVSEAGMKAYVNIVVGHYNARSEELRGFLDYLEENNWGIVFNCALPTENWKNKYDVMLTQEDSAVLEALKQEHPAIIRD